MEPKEHLKFRLYYAVIPLLYFPAFYFLKVARRAHEIDFGSYYTWAYGIRHGINPYIGERIQPLADWLAIKRMPVANYPPTFILAFQPLTYLSIEHAFAVWSVINFALLLIAVGLLIGMVTPIAHPMLLGALALMYGPVTDALYWGQAEVMVLFLLALALWAMQKKSDVFCGVIVGAAVLWKLYPVLLFGYFLICRRTVIFICACVTIATGALVSLAVFGIPINLAFLQQLQRSSGTKFLPYALNLSLGATISRSVWLIAGHRLSAPLEHARVATIYIAQLLVVVATVCGTLGALKKGRERLAFGLWVSAIVLINPIVWFHHLILLLIPLALIVDEPFIDRVALELSAASYCFLALALIACWVRWTIWPLYDGLAQASLTLLALVGLLLTFASTLYSCTKSNTECNQKPDQTVISPCAKARRILLHWVVMRGPSSSKDRALRNSWATTSRLSLALSEKGTNRSVDEDELAGVVP